MWPTDSSRLFPWRIPTQCSHAPLTLHTAQCSHTPLTLHTAQCSHSPVLTHTSHTSHSPVLTRTSHTSHSPVHYKFIIMYIIVYSIKKKPLIWFDLFWKLQLEREHFLGTIAIFKFIFGLFWFILKQICLFWFGLFWKLQLVLLLLLRSFLVCFGSFWNKSVCFSFFKIHSKHRNIPKQNFSLVLKMNLNKCETDPVSVIFGSNRNFLFCFVDMDVYSKRSRDYASFSWLFTVKDFLIQSLCSWLYTEKDLVIQPLFHGCIQ